MKWRLRRAEAGDAPALSLVAAATFLETFAGTLAGPDIVAHVAGKSDPATFARWIADPASCVGIAEHPVGAAPVGYTVLTPPDLPIALAAGDLELRRIYTLSVTRGTGLGHALLDRAVAHARAAGASRVLLGVYGGNGRARAFYEREGFEIVGERRFLVGATLHDDLIYARSL